MSNNLKIIFAFALGAAAGSAVAWKFLKKKYEDIAQEEIDSVKEVYSKKSNHENSAETFDIHTAENVDEYNAMLDELKYSNDDKEKGGSETMNDILPEVIPPDEFGEDDNYDCIGLTYYADGILTDDGDDPITDIDDTVGPEALDSFGEWEDDAVYVKNTERKCYYEILRDNSNYSDLHGEDEE